MVFLLPTRMHSREFEGHTSTPRLTGRALIEEPDIVLPSLRDDFAPAHAAEGYQAELLAQIRVCCSAQVVTLAVTGTR